VAPPDAADLLRKVPLFQALRPPQLAALAGAALSRRVEQGEDLAVEGRPSPGLVIVRSGRVTRGSQELAAGAWFGEADALDVRMADVTATAAEPAECLVLPARALHDVVRADPELAVALLREASRWGVVPAEAEEDTTQLMRYAADLRDAFRASERREEKLRSSVLAAVRSLVALSEAKHGWTRGHAARSARTARELARALGRPDDEVGHSALGGLLHDIGYIAVDSAIFAQARQLTPADQAQIQAHPEVGARLIEHLDFLQPVVPYVLHHHERIDGRGYPRGLGGRSIPLQGRLMAAVEALESLRSLPQGPPLNRPALIRELRGQIDVQLDRKITITLCDLLNSGALDVA
jgi:putative nucleotidyltransferase with HDIG domain